MKITAKNLVKKYKGRSIVKEVSLEVNSGEIVGLLGPNGAGKTTCFYSIVGLVALDQGNVFLDSKDITKYPLYMRARMGVGYLPQEASIFRDLSVEDNIMTVLEMQKESKVERKKKVEELLEDFSIKHIRKNLGRVLSGGERRRTEMARSLAMDPKFILLDEPFAGVDPIAVEDMQNLVLSLKKRNIGVLITDHNVQETLSIIDRAYLMYEGKVLKSGTSEDLSKDEIVKRVYLGEKFELKKREILDIKTKNYEKESLKEDNEIANRDYEKNI